MKNQFIISASLIIGVGTSVEIKSTETAVSSTLQDAVTGPLTRLAKAFEAKGYTFPEISLEDAKTARKNGFAYCLQSDWLEAADEAESIVSITVVKVYGS